MATKIKAKVMRTPNLDSVCVSYEDLEKDIENFMEKQIENGWTFVAVSGGDSFLVLLFSKTT
jgi:hypothetical protein